MTAELPVVDLDRPDTWPEGIVAAIEAEISALVAEREADRAFDLSGDHWFKDGPPMPVTERLTALVEEAMRDRNIRVFHATRLLDFEQIRREGLRPLALEERIADLKALTASGPLAAYADKFDARIARIDLSFYDGRVGQVWFTPMRRALHDGGCDVFFEHWGGEFIQRLASEAGMVRAIRGYGTPAIVVARIPAYGCAGLFQDRMLAPTMINLVIERAGQARYETNGWDVMIEDHVPAEWIEEIYALGDPEVADTPRPRLLEDEVAE